METIIGILTLLTINAFIGLDTRQTFYKLTREEWQMLDRLENPEDYE